ncbi:MAG: serpin family protein, partial [Candidatus Syntrophosphaera sp.]
MKRYLIILAVLAFCFGCSCNKAEKTGNDDQVLQPSYSGSQNNDFAFQIYQEAERSGENLFFSPYSISSALSMVHAGAKGKTAEGIARAMSFNAPDEARHASFGTMQAELNALGEEGRAEMNVANALFGSDANSGLLREDYLGLLRENYSSELFSLDFSDPHGTADFINAWVEEQTQDRIKDLISPSHITDSNNGLVLANAIYFKGNWMKMFDPERTRRDYFYISSQDRTPDSARPVEMMSIKDTFAYAEFTDCQVLELPYAEEDLAMLVLLPREIDQLRSALNQ